MSSSISDGAGEGGNNTTSSYHNINNNRTNDHNLNSNNDVRRRNEYGHNSDRGKCIICHDCFKDTVYMSCGFYHMFCFECICKWILEKVNEDVTCPTCRGGDNAILLSTNKPIPNNNYFSLNHFLNMKPILEHVLDIKIKNSCIVSTRLIKLYMLNKNIIEIIEGYIMNPNVINIMKIDDIIKCFKWEIPQKTCCNCSYSSYNTQNRRTFFDAVIAPVPPETPPRTFRTSISRTPLLNSSTNTDNSINTTNSTNTTISTNTTNSTRFTNHEEQSRDTTV